MKFAKKRDIIIVVALVAVGLIVWALFSNVFGRTGAVAEIYYKSELVKTVDLTPGTEETFRLKEHPGIEFHKYSDGSIAFVEADCPDKICIKTGRLHLVGQTAACLPNQVYMKIVGTGKSDPNAPDVIIG